jgi:2-phosphosulfolactate phosphatase
MTLWMDIMRPDARPQHRGVEILHATGIDGARDARGVVVVIDVSTVDEALALAQRIPDAIVCAEENALPIPGIDISNSPTQIRAAHVQGRTLIQRSSAGTQVIGAVRSGDGMFAGSLVVASATAQACLLRHPSTVTLVASADYPEDHACAQYIEAALLGGRVDLDLLLQPLRESERYRKVMAGKWPGFPATDVELSLAVDRFDFAMPATRQDGNIALRRFKAR